MHLYNKTGVPGHTLLREFDGRTCVMIEIGRRPDGPEFTSSVERKVPAG